MRNDLYFRLTFTLLVIFSVFEINKVFAQPACENLEDYKNIVLHEDVVLIKNAISDGRLFRINEAAIVLNYFNILPSSLDAVGRSSIVSDLKTGMYVAKVGCGYKVYSIEHIPKENSFWIVGCASISNNVDNYYCYGFSTASDSFPPVGLSAYKNSHYTTIQYFTRGAFDGDGNKSINELFSDRYVLCEIKGNVEKYILYQFDFNVGKYSKAFEMMVENQLIIKKMLFYSKINSYGEWIFDRFAIVFDPDSLKNINDAFGNDPEISVQVKTSSFSSGRIRVENYEILK